METFDGIPPSPPLNEEAFIVVNCSRARIAFSRLSNTSDFKCFTKPINSVRDNGLDLLSTANLKRLLTLLPPRESSPSLQLRLSSIVRFEFCRCYYRYLVVVLLLDRARRRHLCCCSLVTERRGRRSPSLTDDDDDFLFALVFVTRVPGILCFTNWSKKSSGIASSPYLPVGRRRPTSRPDDRRRRRSVARRCRLGKRRPASQFL